MAPSTGGRSAVESRLADAACRATERIAAPHYDRGRFRSCHRRGDGENHSGNLPGPPPGGPLDCRAGGVRHAGAVGCGYSWSGRKAFSFICRPRRTNSRVDSPLSRPQLGATSTPTRFFLRGTLQQLGLVGQRFAPDLTVGFGDPFTPVTPAGAVREIDEGTPPKGMPRDPSRQACSSSPRGALE